MNEGTNLHGGALDGVTGHVNGYNAYDRQDGTLFFTYEKDGIQALFDANYNIYNITGGNFHVNKDLLADPRLFCAAAHPRAEGGESDNSMTFGFLGIYSDKTLFLQGNIMDFVSGTASELGIDLSQARKFEANYIDVVNGVDNQRLAISGVNLDEEVSDMIRFQHQFNVASMLVNVIDRIYDTLINRLGAF